MGWFRKFLGLRPRTRRVMEDPTFGHIEFEDLSWEHVPQRSSHEPMIVVVAPETGPSESQRAFYRGIVTNLSDYKAQAMAFIASQRADVDVSSLELYGIEVGSEDGLKDGRFVLEFADESEIEIQRVEFCHYEPVGYAADS